MLGAIFLSVEIRACPTVAFSFPTLCRILRHLPFRENAAFACGSGRWLMPPSGFALREPYPILFPIIYLILYPIILGRFRDSNCLSTFHDSI